MARNTAWALVPSLGVAIPLVCWKFVQHYPIGVYVDVGAGAVEILSLRFKVTCSPHGTPVGDVPLVDFRELRLHVDAHPMYL